MSFTLKDKLKYRFERYLNKGGASIFTSLFIVFVILFLLIFGLRFAILYFFPDLRNPDHIGFSDDAWVTWLELTDPGNMNQDNHAPTWLKITTVLSGVVGVIILSMLIAFITTTLENVFYNFRKGRGKVIEENHTLILGWNERVVDIIRELILANESEKRASVVILSTLDKEEMDDLIAKRLPDTKTTRIVTTTGDYANLNELRRVNLDTAKSVIILANCSDSAGIEAQINSDVQSVKAIMGIRSIQGDKIHIPIITEIFTEEKRQLISFFDDENIIALDSWDIMGKLLVQTSLTSGLEMVYNEILSFDGCEIYFHEADWKGITFGELPYHFSDGIPLGIFNEQDGMRLRPESEYVMKKEDQLIILAEDDSTIQFQSTALVKPKKLKEPAGSLEKRTKNILILGWHKVAEIFIREATDYLDEGSVFRILFKEENEYLREKVIHLKAQYPGFTIELQEANSLKYEELLNIQPFTYDNLIILSQDLDDQSADKIDSDTLIILLWLRKIKESIDHYNTKIITQVLNSENQEIITQTDVDDFIISNKLITMILAQLSEAPLIKLVYDDLFSEDGSEIYVKPAHLYFDSFPNQLVFADIIGVAARRNEVCLGIRKAKMRKDAQSNFGVKLNLGKTEEVVIEEGDFLVVLSEDEL